MFHLIGTVFTYNAHITLPALSPDSTSQTVLLFAGLSLVFFLTIFGVVRKHFYLKKNPSWHSFLGGGIYWQRSQCSWEGDLYFQK